MNNQNKLYGDKLYKSENLKILILTSSYPWYKGDLAGNFVYEQAFFYKQYGYIPFILTPYSIESTMREKTSGIEVYRFPYFIPNKHQRLNRVGGFTYHYKNDLLAKFQLPFFLFINLMYSIILLKKENIKLINSHWLIPQGFIGAICKLLFKCKHINTMHSSEISYLTKSRFGKHIANFIVVNSDYIISVSKHRYYELLNLVSPSFKKLLVDKSIIIPMGVNKNVNKTNNINDLRLKYGVKNNFVILFVGRLNEIKGVEYLILSIKKVKSIIKNVLLLIVGYGPLEPKLKKMAYELELKKYIRFEGHINHEKINDYYNISDVLVLPSIDTESGLKEGVPLVLLEALMAGIPIISSDVAGAKEVIIDKFNGILVKQGNSEYISEQIINMYNSEDLRKKLSCNALHSSKKYEWDYIIKNYISIIDNIMLRS